MGKGDIRDFGDVVDAIQAMEVKHGQHFSQLAQTVADLAATTKEATSTTSSEVRVLTRQLIEHPLTCPIKTELRQEISSASEDIKTNAKEINRLSVFAGKIIGTVAGWGLAAGIAGFFLVKWLETLLPGRDGAQ